MKKLTLAIVALLLLTVAMGAGAAEPSYHTIVAGDTLYKLAEYYKTTILEFLDFNPKITPDKLEIGQKVLIPVEPLWSYHVVQAGDNVKALAKAYQVPEDTLRLANQLNKTGNKLTVGEMIRIPIHFYLGDSKTNQLSHKVEIGDTLYKIANHYKVTLSQLIEWNEITDIDAIIAGQTLIVG